MSAAITTFSEADDRTRDERALAADTRFDVPDGVSIVAVSPKLDREAVEIVVTLPTYKRPEHLLRTLRSLQSQKTRRAFAVIVMDNEAEKAEGAAACRSLFEDGALDGVLLIAQRRGNCEAYNAGWRTALAAFPNFTSLLIIDDDEIAEERWLARMSATAETLDVDIVGGPQVPIFEDGSGSTMARHPVFAAPYDQTGPVDRLYSSGNLLIRRRVLEAMAPDFLDLRFNFMGGGDADFLRRAADRGFSLGWCAEAVVRETIPARRLQRDWITARSIRNGVISSLVDRRSHDGEPFGLAQVTLKSLALLAASPVRAAIQMVRSGSFTIGLYPVLIGIGRILGQFGYMNEQYRDAEKN